MGIVNGIKSCISAVGDAVKSVADKIKSFLHFSVPDEGPLTDYEKRMPDFMKDLAKGIEDSKGMVTKAMDSLSADMVISPQMNGMQAAMAGGGRVSGTDLSSLVSAIREAVGGVSTSGQGGDIVSPVYLGGTMLDEVIVNAQQRVNLRAEEGDEMSFIQYLTFEGEDLPLPDSYEVNLEDKEADSGGETEAGTIQRDVVRAGVVEISVSFSVTQVWLKKLTIYKNQ